MTKANVMLDLETLGTSPGCVVLSLGAVVFSSATGLGATFYRSFEVGSQITEGLKEDPDTLKWWSEQSVEARAAAFSGDTWTCEALRDFQIWYRENGEKVWSHGASFDVPVLDAVYETFEMESPWKYSQSRCTRTLYDLADVWPDRSAGVQHNALDDAISQAQAALKAAAVLGVTL